VKWLVLVLVATTAHAQPKPMPAKLVQAASDAFAKAQAAEAKGNLTEAIHQYERAMAIAPHPNTQFNLAEAQRAAKDFVGAATSYAKYLELAPDASDRAHVEKLVAQLRAMPGTVDLETEEIGALAYLDGVLVGPAPRKVELPTGTHQLDLVTPITFSGSACVATAGRHSSCRATARPRVDGNVIISGSWNLGGLEWSVDHQRFRVHGRFPAKPGHYELTVDKRQCKPLPLDVPAGDDVLTYAFITMPEEPRDVLSRPCMALSIAQHRVAFP
jgi:tetratricopeptide (TPR) repeat protein